MIVTMGGRAAEELVFNSITTGASDDLKKVARSAYAQMLELGMSERMGPAAFGALSPRSSFDVGFSEEIHQQVDEEVRQMANTAYAEAKRILKENWEVFEKLAQRLQEKESLTFDDCEAILGPRPFTSEAQTEYIKMRDSIKELNKEAPTPEAQ